MIYNDDFDSFEPKDYCDFAFELYNNINYFNCEKSAVIRSIISRAYYAAFLQVRQWLIENTNHSFNKGREHSKVLEILKKEKPIGMSFFNDAIYDFLYTLEKNRVHCDYYFKSPDYHNVWSNKDLNNLLDHSKWIISNVDVDSFSK